MDHNTNHRMGTGHPGSSESPGSPAAPDRRKLAKAFVASLTGTSLEWYDFAVYSAASALVFGKLFFPSGDPLTGTLLAFSTYAVGYVSRPVGGFVFGRLGDVIGRKKVLVATLVLVGLATFLIGALPTHAVAGPIAPALLVLLRFAQGVGVGGEWGGAVLLTSEFGNTRQRGFWASAAQIGPPVGNLMANGALAVLGGTLTDAQFLSFGWRIAFLLSGVLVAFGLWVRVRLEETPVFQAVEASGDRPEAPVREVFATQRRQLIAAILCRVAPDVLYAMFTVFVLTYVTEKLGMPRGQALTAVLVGSALQIFLIPLAGHLSDRWNRKRMYLVAAVAAGIWPFIFFPLANTRSWPLLVLGVIGALVIHSAMYGPQAAFVAEQFNPRLRYTGSSLAYTLAGVIGGAVAPLVLTALLGTFGTWLPLAGYIVVTAVLTVVGLLLGRDADHGEDEEYIRLLGGPGSTGAAPLTTDQR